MHSLLRFDAVGSSENSCAAFATTPKHQPNAILKVVTFLPVFGGSGCPVEAEKKVELLGTIYIKSNDQTLFIGSTKYLFMPPWPWVTYISGCDVYGQVLVMAWIRSTGTHSLGLDIPSALSFDTSLQNLSSTLHCSSTALV